jgi:hypothetical protein
MSPKLISSVIGGSPAFSGGDILSPPMQVAVGGATVGALAFAGAGSMMAAGRLGISALQEATSFAGRALSSRGSGSKPTGGSAIGRTPPIGGNNGGSGSGPMSGTGQVPPPKRGPAGRGGSGGGQVPPPGKGSGPATNRTSGGQNWSRQSSTSGTGSVGRTSTQPAPTAKPSDPSPPGATFARVSDALSKGESAAKRASHSLRRVRDDLNRIQISDGGHHPAPPPGFSSGSGFGGSE